MTSKVYYLLFLELLFRSSSGFYFGIPANNRNDKQIIYQTPGNTNRFERQMPPHHEPDAVIINVGGNQPGIPGGYPSFDIPNGPDVYGRPQGPPVFGMPGRPNVFGGPRGPGIFGIPGGRGGPGVFGIPNGQNGPGLFGIPNGQSIPGVFGNPGGPGQPGNPNMFGAPGVQGFGWGFAGERLPMPNGGETFLTPSGVTRSLDGFVPRGFLPTGAGGMVPGESAFIPFQPGNVGIPGGIIPRPEIYGGTGGREVHDDPIADPFPLIDKSSR
ncbi:Translation initiation factor IF-2, partial [Stegodyphus mimosarum]